MQVNFILFYHGVEREPEGDNAATDNHGNGVLTGIFGSQDRTTSEVVFGSYFKKIVSPQHHIMLIFCVFIDCH